MTTKHVCPRCGLESRCLRRRWWDRHPVAAALFALPTLYTVIGVILAYPWFFVPLLIIGLAWWVDRRNRRRASTAARADWEYGQEMLRAVRETEAPTAWLTTSQPRTKLRPVMTRWPTTPMQTSPAASCPAEYRAHPANTIRSYR